MPMGDSDPEGMHTPEEPSKWQSSWWAERLREDQVRAARFVGRFPDESDRIEQMMHLEAGTISKWLEEDTHFASAVRLEFEEQEARRRTVVDFERVLTPTQVEAARLYYVEHSRQIEVARALKITDRTMRNWLDDPIFVEFGKFLRRRQEAMRNQERKEREDELRKALRERWLRAFGVIDMALEADDVKTALELVRPLLGRLGL
jgi:hypothetical protein